MEPKARRYEKTERNARSLERRQNALTKYVDTTLLLRVNKLLALDAFVNVDFQSSKRGFMTLKRHSKRVIQTFSREEVDDDTLGNRDRLRRNAHRLGIETKIDDQFFRRAGNAAKVRIGSDDVRIVNFELRTRCRLGGVFFFFIFRHGGFSLNLCLASRRFDKLTTFGESRQALVARLAFYNTIPKRILSYNESHYR